VIKKYRKDILCWIFSGLLVGICISINTADAGTVPGFRQHVKLQAVDQSVPSFIESLFSQIGMPVKIESDIPGKVNGSFEGTAESVFAKISQSFNVYVYSDLQVAYVYQTDQMKSSILPLNQAAAVRVAKGAKKLGLPDVNNTVNAIPGGGLMVSGSSRFVDQIEELSKATRKQTQVVQSYNARTEFKLFRLKYAWADDVTLNVGGRSVEIPGVATLLRTLVTNGSSMPLASGVSVTRDPNTVQKLRGQGLKAVSGKDSESPKHQTTNYNGSSDFSIVAQPQLNAVAIRDSSDRMPMYQELIDSLDVEPAMVEIEATIIDINVDKQRELGVNWRAQGSDAQVLLGDGTAADTLLQPGQIIAPQGRGGVLSLVLGDSTEFFARVRALEEEGAARIVSKPHVITLSNVEAVLGATTEFFVRVEGNDEVDLFNVPVGTVLRVTPHVYEQRGLNGIKLLVNIEDGTAATGARVDNIPVVERSTISTQALIQEGSSLLIGGLVRESTTESEVGVPVLRKVPVLGGLFRSERKNHVKTERLFMITPRIADSFQKHLDLRGPVLQGDPVDIITNANRISADETLAMAEQLDLNRKHIDQLENTTDQNLGILSVAQTRALLDIPPATVAYHEDTKDWNHWNSAGTVSRPEIVSEFVNDFTETPDDSSGAPSTSTAQVYLVPVTDSEPPTTNVRDGIQNDIPSAITYPIDISHQDNNSRQVTVQTLVLEIDADIEARRLTSPRSNNALAKIRKLKEIAPEHEYAISGERYIARTYAQIGHKSFEKGNFTGAQAMYEKAARIDPKANGVQALKVQLQQQMSG